MQGDSSLLRKGCSTHPTKPITTTTEAHPPGKLETCFSSFPRPSESHADTWWQLPPRQLQLSHQGTKPALTASWCPNGAETAQALHPALLTLPPPNSCIFLTPEHTFPCRICYVNHMVRSQKQHCSVLQCSWILDCFLGMQFNSNPLCFRKSSTFFMQREQLQIPASDSHMTH